MAILGERAEEQKQRKRANTQYSESDTITVISNIPPYHYQQQHQHQQSNQISFVKTSTIRTQAAFTGVFCCYWILVG